MKNWIIALAILVVPIVSYYFLEKNQAENTAAIAQSHNMSKPVVMKFSSPMCLDCKKLDTIMNEVMPKYETKITYQKINAQSNDDVTQSLIKKYTVNLVPTTIFVKKDGTVYKRTEGVVEKKELEKILNGLIEG